MQIKQFFINTITYLNLKLYEFYYCNDYMGYVSYAVIIY
jgi:hypothetical protein